MSWFRSNNQLIVRCMMRCMRMHVLEQWEIFHNIRMHLPAKNIHCKIKMQRVILLTIYICILHLYLIPENCSLAFR